jgi:Na+/phosphate symporter
VGIIFISLAATLASMGAANPQMAFFLVGLILVMSLPFLLFTFVTTLINHIEVGIAEEDGRPATFMAPPSVAHR